MSNKIVLGVVLRKYRLSLLIFLAGGTLSLFLLLNQMENDRHNVDIAFAAAAQIHFAAIEQLLENSLNDVERLASFIEVTNPTSHHQFHTYAAALLHTTPGLQALEWIPRVKAADRANVETAARNFFPHFRFTEENPAHRLVTEAIHEEYFPVYYVEPHQGNEQAVGFDLSSEKVRREALLRSAETGHAVATAKITLVQETGSQFAVLVFFPVYKSEAPLSTANERRAALLGFALSVMRIGDVVETALKNTPVANLDIQLRDTSAPPGEQHIYTHISRATTHPVSEDAPKNKLDRQFIRFREPDFGGRRWSLMATPAQGHFELARGWRLWGLPLAAFLLTVLMIAYLESINRQRAALGESEARYRRLFEVSPDGIFIQVGRTIVLANDACARMLGAAAPNILVGKPIFDFLRPGSQKVAGRLMEELAEQKRQAVKLEDQIVRTDGTTVHVEVTATQFKYGDRDGFQVVLHDISERKKVEEVRERYAAIVENSSDAIYSRTLDGTIVSWNPGAEKMLGYGAAEMIGKSTDLIVPPGRQDNLARNNEKILRGETVEARESNRLAKDGRVIDVIVSNSPVKDGAGRVIGASVILKDITEYKRAQDALRAAEEQFRGLVEQSIAGIYIIQDGKLAYVNPRAAEIVGQGSANDLIGTDPLVWVVEADRGAAAENLRRLIEGEAQSATLDFRVLRRDGVLIEVGAHGTRAMYEGRPAVIGMVQDISEKKRAEEQIQHYVDQLKTAFMSTVEVATTLSEMRDPYTAGHERRVAEIAMAIGAELGLDERRQEGLRVAGHLHDIGKINIPAEILSKPGKLSKIEYQLIQGHPRAGYDVLKDVEFPWPVAQVALQHHERMDGSGYPQGLKGEAILFEARIMAVADVVEAMSSHRPYRPGLGIDKALAEIERGRGTAYDTNVADACLRLFRERDFQLPE